jgi:LmbE family N-acetylglucosaminyl deacetylase
MMSERRLLGIFAHPDDEDLMAGTFLHYHSQGVMTGLVCVTRGEVGDIADAVLATPENLGQVREGELRAAAATLQVDRLWLLEYRDSGRLGTPENQDPRALIQARGAKVMGKLVAIIREFRPQVLVTFDEAGGYGHPDHIVVYKYATGAFHSAADPFQYPELGPAFAPSKLYYVSVARRQVVLMTEWLQNQAYEGFVRDLDVEKVGFADDQIDVVMDVERWHDIKIEATHKHLTQLRSNAAFALLPAELQHRWRSTEYFQLVTSRVGPDTIGDNDLFAHIS